MIGTTGLKNLQIGCIVGVYEQERAQPQPVVIDIELDYTRASRRTYAARYAGVAPCSVQSDLTHI